MLKTACTGLTLGWLALTLSSCSTPGVKRYSQHQDSAPDQRVDVSRVADAVPRTEPRSRYGNPASYVVRGKRYRTLSSSTGYRQRGIASWYGTKFHGHRTSSGENYDMYKMSAAHKTLPLPTYARVTNLRNNRSVIVKINDRGPFHENRLIDLSYAAASRLGILKKGTGLVEIEAINPALPVPGKAPAQHLASHPKTDTRIKATSLTLASPPRLYLQVGAFLSRSNAEQLKHRLETTAPASKLHISEGNTHQQHLYRVRIGPLDSVETADRLAQSLLQHGVKLAHVVID